ncbi:MAG: response regulator [Oscillospiraceae bacterium]|nr:response regulator [Oscillospiraceae bacterium]
MYKVIIVDDEEPIVRGLTQLLPWESNGCQVAGTAADGRQALELIRREKPDILFTDIAMPGMDGLSLIAALRSEFPELQIAILSGYPQFSFAQRAIELGVSGYIIKPSRMSELEAVLQKMVGQLKQLEAAGQPAAQAVTGAADHTPAAGPRQVAASREQGTEPETAPPDPAAEASNFVLSQARAYMAQHYAERLTLPEVAAAVYVSQWHLSKLISRYTGQSFYDLLNRIRLKEACRLLADPSLSIAEVGERVGFADAAHFSKIFKKYQQISANTYRNQLQH